MDRRKFLKSALGVAGTLTASRAIGKPCPPVNLFAQGATSGPNPECGMTTLPPSPSPIGTAPQWFVDMPDKTWTAVAGGSGFGQNFQNGSRIADVLPLTSPGGSAAAICTAWTGGCVDQNRKEFILAANGGHTDYNGNEVYTCKLNLDVPTWYRITDPTPTDSQGAATDTYGTYNLKECYADGNPRSVHGWNRCCWGGDQIWYAGLDGCSPSGNWTTAVYSFNRSAADGTTWPIASHSAPWNYLGLGLPVISGGNLIAQGGVANWDRINGVIWSVSGEGTNGSGQGVYTVNTSTHAIKQYSFGPWEWAPRWGAIAYGLRASSDPGAWILFDSVNGTLLLTDLQNPNGNPGGGFYTYTVSGLSNFDTGTGAVYHAASKAVLLWNNSGTGIGKLSIPSNPIGGTYVLSMVSPAAANHVTPTAAQGNGTYGRFNIVEDMGNGQSALVIINDINQPVYVYKMPAAGV